MTGFTETITKMKFGETIGETMFLERRLEGSRLDLSTEEGQDSSAVLSSRSPPAVKGLAGAKGGLSRG